MYNGVNVNVNGHQPDDGKTETAFHAACNFNVAQFLWASREKYGAKHQWRQISDTAKQAERNQESISLWYSASTY
jgi:hypothetical protein